jgi:hypothetical protein
MVTVRQPCYTSIISCTNAAPNRTDATRQNAQAKHRTIPQQRARDEQHRRVGIGMLLGGMGRDTCCVVQEDARHGNGTDEEGTGHSSKGTRHTPGKAKATQSHDTPHHTRRDDDDEGKNERERRLGSDTLHVT